MQAACTPRGSAESGTRLLQLVESIEQPTSDRLRLSWPKKIARITLLLAVEAAADVDVDVLVVAVIDVVDILHIIIRQSAPRSG